MKVSCPRVGGRPRTTLLRAILVPALGARYYTLAFMDLYGRPYHLGTRSNGGKAMRYALVGPSGGKIPEGYVAFPLPTDTAWMLGRVLVNGLDDAAEAQRVARSIVMRGATGQAVTEAKPLKPFDSLVYFDMPYYLVLMVVALVGITDVIFAVDSIPAIFAITDDPFIVLTSNIFAILGLRAMYFLLADLMHRFVYLKLGLGLVLIWVGVKLLLQVDIYKMPTWLSLGVVAVIIAVSIAASLFVTRRGDQVSPRDSVYRGDGSPDDDGSAQEVDLPDQPRTRTGLRPPQS